MFTSAVDFSTLSNSIHGTAFLLGATVYLGYSIFPTVRQFVEPLFHNIVVMLRPKAGEPEDVPHGQPIGAEQQWVPRRQFTRRDFAAAIAFAALLIGLALSAHGRYVEQNNATCPLDLEVASQPPLPPASAGVAQDAGGPQEASVEEALKLRFRSPGAWKFMRQAAPSVPQAAPTELLARAHAAMDKESGWPSLEACAAWVAPSTGADVSELYAQLECNGELLESGATTREAAPALLSRARKLMEAVRADSDVTTGMWESTQVEWARISHGVFQLNCKAVTDELQMQSRRGKASGSTPQAPPRSPATLLASLWSLKRLEQPFKETLAALVAGGKVLQPRSDGASDEAEELHNALGADRSCALQALQQGRLVALALPQGAPLVKRMLQCRPKMLEDFQTLVLSEASQAKDAATLFGLGIYHSDIGLAAEQGQTQVPLFGAGSQPAMSWSSEPIWAADAGGSHAPSEIVQAEAMMQAGEEASVGPDRSDRGASRALRLYQHAKMLALKHHDGAAEWRYRAAAELAATHRRQQLAAHALGRLGYFLSLRGRKEEALEASARALEHNKEDALAQYLQASLKRSLGELQTTEQVLAAERQLSVVAGKLPSKTLEDQRAAAHAELGWWRLVATEGLQVCLRAWDAAQMLICFLCGFTFNVPGAGAEAAQ